MQLYAVQLDIVWEDKTANHARVRAMLEAVSPRPESLIVLPEMFDTGFSLNVETTNDADRSSEAFCAELARTWRSYVQGGRTTVEADGWARNWATVHDPEGTLVTSYAKLHPFGFGREIERFRGGDALAVYSWRSGEDVLTAAPLVCYDLRFPEVFRIAALDHGVELFVVIANWPAERAMHWRALLQARAIENQAYVVGVNRAGTDPHLAYAGGSVVFGPKGQIVAEADEAACVVQASLDPLGPAAWRSAFRALKDARRGLLGHLEASGGDD
jgi:omega-amidase